MVRVICSRRVDFGLRAFIAQHSIQDRSHTELHLVGVVLEIRKAQVGIRVDADHRAPIQLHFCPRVRPGLQMVLRQQRCIHGCGYQISGISATDIHLPVRNTEPRHTMLLVGRHILLRWAGLL